MRGEKVPIKRNVIIPRTQPSFIIAPKKRPSNPLNKWIKERKNSYQVTRKDVCYIYRNIIFTKTFGELKNILEAKTPEAIAKRDSYPALVIAIVASVLGDIARGNTINLVRMLNFVFPDGMKGFDPEEFTNKAGQGGYDEILELENTLRRLEGDDSILIVDKLLMTKTEETPS